MPVVEAFARPPVVRPPLIEPHPRGSVILWVVREPRVVPVGTVVGVECPGACSPDAFDGFRVWVSWDRAEPITWFSQPMNRAVPGGAGRSPASARDRVSHRALRRAPLDTVLLLPSLSSLHQSEEHLVGRGAWGMVRRCGRVERDSDEQKESGTLGSRLSCGSPSARCCPRCAWSSPRFVSSDPPDRWSGVLCLLVAPSSRSFIGVRSSPVGFTVCAVLTPSLGDLLCRDVGLVKQRSPGWSWCSPCRPADRGRTSRRCRSRPDQRPR